MYRDILTNKWVLGGVGFLIVLSIACYFWYQHDIADERKAAADAQELLRQWERSQQTDTHTKQQITDDVPVESNTQSTEKPITNEIDSDVIENAEIEAQTQDNSQVLVKNTETIEVPTSPFGYGPYPEVPTGFPSNIRIPWRYPVKNPRPDLELAARVLIKLWNQGDTAITGANINEDYIVYPHYPNTAYVTRSKITLNNGDTAVRMTLSGGPGLPYITDDMLLSGHVPGIRLINKEDAGIDALEFLGLK